jgi:hypothetical protein
VLFLSENIDLGQVNVLDMDAKKVLETLAELNQGEYAKGEQLQQKTGLSPEVLNKAIRVLEKSVMVDNPSISKFATVRFCGCSNQQFWATSFRKIRLKHKSGEGLASFYGVWVG